MPPVETKIVIELKTRPYKERSRDDYDYGKGSKAMIAASDDPADAFVMFAVGGPVTGEIEDLGIRLTDDLGLNPPEPGLWVWEGIGVWYSGSYEYPQDGDYVLEGEFRRPTPEEVAAAVAGDCPWDDSDFKRSHRVWTVDKETGKPAEVVHEAKTLEEALSFAKGMAINPFNLPVVESPTLHWFNVRGESIQQPGSPPF